VIDGTIDGARNRLSSATTDLDGLPAMLDSANRRGPAARTSN